MQFWVRIDKSHHDLRRLLSLNSSGTNTVAAFLRPKQRQSHPSHQKRESDHQARMRANGRALDGLKARPFAGRRIPQSDNAVDEPVAGNGWRENDWSDGTLKPVSG